jgi:hypothetical protein
MSQALRCDKCGKFEENPGGWVAVIHGNESSDFCSKMCVAKAFMPWDHEIKRKIDIADDGAGV